MPGLPPLIQEDVTALDAALDDLLRDSEAVCALVIDKGGPMICQRGAAADFDTTTISALAAGSFCATQAIAGLINEKDFSNIYQQGEQHSLLFCTIDDNVLLIVIFKAVVSVGVVKYYAARTVQRVAAQLHRASQRSPQASVDLVGMNLADASSIFRKHPEA